MRFGERLINSAERRIGNWALPGIMKWIVGIQFLGMCFVMLSEGQLMEGLLFDRSEILSGEAWRLITWLFVPSQMGFIGILFLVYFTFFISNIIEEHLGIFRTNVLVISTIVCFILAGLVPFPERFMDSYYVAMPVLYVALFVMVAAIMVPDYTIMLMMIIPIKMKWIGVIDLAVILMVIFGAANPFVVLIAVIIAFLPLLLGILPPVLARMKGTAQATVRRSKFERDAGINDDSAFHTCHNCGITDVKDPVMEFRVSSDDGNEYCLPCRERQK